MVDDITYFNIYLLCFFYMDFMWYFRLRINSLNCLIFQLYLFFRYIYHSLRTYYNLFLLVYSVIILYFLPYLHLMVVLLLMFCKYFHLICIYNLFHLLFVRYISMPYIHRFCFHELKRFFNYFCRLFIMNKEI